MRLSEAIRLGSMLGPQAFGMFMNDGGTCAFGAAGQAIGETFGPGCTRFIPALVWPWLSGFQYEQKCPDCQTVYCTVGGLIVHLNDDHRRTRESIADFVEQQERAIGLWDEPVAAESPILAAHENQQPEPYESIDTKTNRTISSVTVNASC